MTFVLSELGAVCPLIHSCLRVLDDWKRQLTFQLTNRSGGCPNDFLPDMTIDKSPSFALPLSMVKYRRLFDPDNTPFSATDHRADPIRRLWLFLVRQEHLTETFVRFIYRSSIRDQHVKRCLQIWRIVDILK